MATVSKGLNIDEDAFMKLKPKEQNRVLFTNQVATLKAVLGYKFHQKVQYVTIGGLTVVVGILLKVALLP